MDVAGQIASVLVGGQLAEVERGDYIWVFRFSDNARLTVECPWRIVSAGGIAFTNADHEQRFGLPKPLDGVEESNRLLRDKTIQAVAIREDTGDITIEFSDDTALEVLNNSSGYEAWNYSDRRGMKVVAMGGGELAIWDPHD